MKKSLCAAVFAVLLVVFIAAPSATMAAEAGSYVSVDWLSSYVLGSGFQSYNHPVWDIEAGNQFENGVGTSLWVSLPASFNSLGENAGTEIDLNLWYKFKSVPVTVGTSYYVMFPDNNGAVYRNDIWQINAEISKEVFTHGDFTATTTFRVEYNFPVSGAHNKQTTGLYLIPSLDLAYKVSDKLNVNLNNKFEIDLGGYGADKALITKIAPRVTYKMSDALSLNGGIDMYFPTITTSGEERKDLFVPRVGMSYAF